MKYLAISIVIVAALFGAKAMAEVDCQGLGQCQDQTAIAAQLQAQGQIQGQAQGFTADLANDSESTSDAQSEALSESLAGSLSESSNGDQSLTLHSEYEAVASSAAELNLAYCTDGTSMQNKDGGFSVANVNFICESSAALNVSLLLVEMELAAADRMEPISPENADMHMLKAYEYMEDSKTIMAEVVAYIQRRSNTASLAAGTRDIAWPIALLSILIWLL